MYFEQKHPPGREAQMDFTHCDSFEVTIGGEPFPHMVFEFILSHSGWRYAQICFSETAIMQLGHLGSCLTRSETGRYAFRTICRRVFEMATQYRGSRWAVTS